MPEAIRFGDAVRYPFREQGWAAKAGILALLSFIPVLNIAAVGYEVEIALRVAKGESSLLPAWGDLAVHFRRGIGLAIARYIYFLPILMLMALAFVAASATLFTVDTRYEAWSWLFGLACGGGILLGVVFGLVFSVVSPAVTVRYLEIGTLAACFDFPAIWGHVRLHPKPHLAVFGWILALSLGLGLLVGPASVFLGFIPCLGTLVYPLLYAAMISALLLVLAHLEGQLLRIVLGSAVPSLPA
jgi:hypothetical protein